MKFTILDSGIAVPDGPEPRKIDPVAAVNEIAHKEAGYDPPHTDWQVDRTESDHEGFIIRYRPWNGDWESCYVVDFEAYEIHHIKDSAFVFEMPGRPNEFTKEFHNAQRYLHGDVKWDGCSNWHFDIQDGCMIHFCSVEETQEISRLFEKMYEIAKEVTGTTEY